MPGTLVGLTGYVKGKETWPLRRPGLCNAKSRDGGIRARDGNKTWFSVPELAVDERAALIRRLRPKANMATKTVSNETSVFALRL